MPLLQQRLKSRYMPIFLLEPLRSEQHCALVHLLAVFPVVRQAALVGLVICKFRVIHLEVPRPKSIVWAFLHVLWPVNYCWVLRGLPSNVVLYLLAQVPWHQWSGSHKHRQLALGRKVHNVLLDDVQHLLHLLWVLGKFRAL